MKLLGSIIAVCLVLNAHAQTLTQQDKTKVLRKAAQLLEEHYVFPDRGKTIAAALLKADANKQFRAADAKTFATAVTAMLKETGRDGHLYLRYDPTKVAELKHKVPETDSVADPFYYGPDAVKNNYGFQEVKVLQDAIGYIRLSEINLSKKSTDLLAAAMVMVQHTKALVLDLRDNGGGGSDVGGVLEGYFVPDQTVLLDFKKRSGTEEQVKAVTLHPEYQYHQPLYILINHKTASAAEAIAFELQQLKRAVIVGERSAGAAHMNDWLPVDDNFFISVSTAAPAFPGTTTSWEQTGVVPDHITTAKEMDLPLVFRLVAKP